MGEVRAMARAAKKRNEHAHQLAAWHACLMINLVSKRKIEIGDLIPSLKKAQARTFDLSAYGGNVDLMMEAMQRAREAAEEEVLYERQ